MSRQRRTDGRAAFVTIADIITPKRQVMIQIFNKKKEPITGLKLKVSLDNTQEKIFETNNSGTMQVPKPQNNITISSI